jgi:glycine oxidase
VSAVDILIVGNGVIGLSVAYELSCRGTSLSITVAGQLDRRGGASVAASAMLSCHSEVTKYSLASASGRHKHALSEESLRRWPTWLDKVNDDAGSDLQTARGTVVIENAVSGYLDSENFDAIVLSAKTARARFELIDPRSVLGLNPVPSARPMRALSLPDEANIDSHQMLQRLSEACEAKGVKFIQTNVRSFQAQRNRITGAILENGDSVRAGVVVCAAGSFTTPLLDTILDPNEIQPVFAGTGVAAVLDTSSDSHLNTVVRSVNRAGSCGLHVVPRDGSHYVGATNAIFGSARFKASAGLSHFLLQCAIDQIDQGYAHCSVREWRIGNRPVPLDGFPLIGWTSIDGLYVATGTYRDGFHNSPVIADIVASEVLGGPAVSPFQPTRAPISTQCVSDSVHETAQNAVCTAFEASLILPRLWRSEILGQLFEPSATELHRRLDTSLGLSQDLVPFLSGGAFSPGTEDHRAFLRVKELVATRGMTADIIE